jgi:hypothetical protein
LRWTWTAAGIDGLPTLVFLIGIFVRLGSITDPFFRGFGDRLNPSPIYLAL